MSIELVMLSNHLILCHRLLLWPSIFPSIGVFSNETAVCIRWPKYWSFSEYLGLISFRINLFLRPLALFMVQLSHLYMTTGKAIALTRQTLVSKVMSLLFNMLSSLVIAFLPSEVEDLSQEHV